VPSGISATPLPPVFYFHEQTPTSPVLYKTGDYPSLLPVPKGAFRVECPTSRGGYPSPPLKNKGGGVSHEWGGGTPLTTRMEDTTCPPVIVFRAGLLPPPHFHKRGGPPPVHFRFLYHGFSCRTWTEFSA